jgi:hypothetical protein
MRMDALGPRDGEAGTSVAERPVPAPHWYETPAGTWLADPEPGVRRGMRVLARGTASLPSAPQARVAAEPSYTALRTRR